MKKTLMSLLTGFLLVVSFVTFAETEVPKLTSHFNDLAGVVAPHLRSQIESRLSDFEKTTSNQVVILVMPTLDGDDIFSFSQRVFESWKLGQKDKDNSVLIVVIKDRVAKGQGKSIYIHPGYGMEGSLPDATCTQIVVDFMKPLMKDGKYTEGFNVGIDKIIAATKGEYKPSKSDVPTTSAPHQSDSNMNVIIFIVGIIAFFFLSGIAVWFGATSAAFVTYLLLPVSVGGPFAFVAVVVAFLIGWGIAHIINRTIFSGRGNNGGDSWGWFSDSSSNSGSSSGSFGSGFSGGGGD